MIAHDAAGATIVVGATGGLGRACVDEALARRRPVAVVDLDGDACRELAAQIAEQHGLPAVGLAADFTEPSSFAAAWNAAERVVGPVDTLLNCAGTFRPQAVLDITDEEWHVALRTNLTGPFVASREAARRWVDAGRAGSIVNVASTAALASAFHEATSYGAAKAGLLGLTTHLAVKLGAHGIRVNVVLPGSFSSPMNVARLKDPEQVSRSVERVPLGRIADAGEIASAVAYLGYDATYVTGVALPVDGGNLVTM